MYVRNQLLMWITVIFALNVVLLAILRDNPATARTQLEELTPTELTQINLTNVLDSDDFTSGEKAIETAPQEYQLTEVKTEKSDRSPQLSLAAENRSAGSVEVYYVHKGDTLWNISRRHNFDLHTLLAYNKLKDPNLIRPGQRIEIPRRHINMQVSP